MWLYILLIIAFYALIRRVAVVHHDVAVFHFHLWKKYHMYPVLTMLSLNNKTKSLPALENLNKYESSNRNTFFVPALIHLTICSYHCTYVFQSKTLLYIFLNVKDPLTQTRCHIWSLSDGNETRTHSHLVRKQKLNHFAKLVKWLNCLVSTYLYGAFYCMFLSSHVHVSE